MPRLFKRPLSLALGALATTMLGGCYSGGVYGASYASGGDCAARYGNAYYDYDGYAYDDGYGYDCYDASDYGGGFVNIGFGGGWYDDYYYPGYGTWMFDRYRNRHPLRDQYLNYWGGRRAWWKHHGRRGDGQPGRPGGWNRGDGDGRPGDGRPGRPGGWNRGDRDNDGPRATRPGRGRGDGVPPTSSNPGAPVINSPVRPPRGHGAVRPRPETVAGDRAPGRPRDGAMRARPDRGEAPRGAGRPVRLPDSPRAAAQPPQQVAQPAPSARQAPEARPAPAPRGERPARIDRVREN